MAAIACVTGLKQTLSAAAFGSTATILDRPAKLVGAAMRLSRLPDCKQPHTATLESSASLSSAAARHRSKHALSDAGTGARKRRSASSIKARILRDFSGPDEVELTALEFSYSYKPLHFNGKYVYIE
ncbi:MAG: hypothetical protein E5V79_05385 [Mesorhizobium sp.]|uniref:hypothetical protein n=1 Tax=Mesorhizobium sp. M2A.F.Ca.ET.043.05.1.1 TaxID=2493671 RepID=UPI000F74F5C7|nr:hypothetical protein [Mesorhizobium sp. M2A.F.Ca.ET.043.05.1.1]AZO18430.1 hypothetical protein EJ069_29570 [Mesorhizobium sp. M2A.F.Ca.ET.043.05.1.1]TIV72690.1 MAG: hypothetical protein E5V79_05385 [Mesorhizobium sp.]